MLTPVAYLKHLIKTRGQEIVSIILSTTYLLLMLFVYKTRKREILSPA